MWMYVRLRGILGGRNSTGEERERQRECFIPYESTSFKIQHGGIEFCVSSREPHTYMYIFTHTHTYIPHPFVQ